MQYSPIRRAFWEVWQKIALRVHHRKKRIDGVKKELSRYRENHLIGSLRQTLQDEHDLGFFRRRRHTCPAVSALNFFPVHCVKPSRFNLGEKPSIVTLGGSVSAVLDSDEINSNNSHRPGAIEIREGDWKAYLESLARCKDDKDVLDRYGSLAEYKRACALAYLGKRAQLHGGVCSTRHPHVMSPRFIAELEAANRTTRHSRYPWLRALMNLLAEIEQIQDQISNTNVITLVPAAK